MAPPNGETGEYKGETPACRLSWRTRTGLMAKAPRCGACAWMGATCIGGCLFRHARQTTRLRDELNAA